MPVMGRTLDTLRDRFDLFMGRVSPRTYAGLLQVENYYRGPSLEWDPAGGRVVVLAPHMDDETIGCGGTLARHVDAGADVTVIFLTDGRQGSPRVQSASGEERAAAERELVIERKAEAQLALAALGVKHIEYLDAPDTRLESDGDVAGKLGTLLETLRPDRVYLPFFLEQHPDHRAASRVLVDAVAGRALSFECHGYEVWTPLLPNTKVWIDTTFDRKKAAMAHYRSQLDDTNDLMHAMTGLAAYRSVVRSHTPGRYAEAFFSLPLAQYVDAFGSFMRSRG